MYHRLCFPTMLYMYMYIQDPIQVFDFSINFLMVQISGFQKGILDPAHHPPKAKPWQVHNNQHFQLFLYSGESSSDSRPSLFNPRIWTYWIVLVLYSTPEFALHQGCSNKFSISSKVLPFVSGNQRNIQNAPLVVRPAYNRNVPGR